MREESPISGTMRERLFTKKLEGVGGVPICKTCKYRTYSNHCMKHLDIITGKPYACDACRELKHDFICGIEGKFYEEKLKKKRRLSNSFVLTMMHIMLLGAVFLLGPSFVAGYSAVLLLELSGLFMFVDHILNRDEGTKGK